jgi:hypothetical protein
MAARVTPATPLILGSQSPRRLELLRALRIPVEPFPVDVDESILPGERPDALATRLARQKGAATLYALGRSGIEGGTRWILCADTIVHIGGELLGKPRDADDARRMIRLLAGRTHHVTTGFVVHAGRRLRRARLRRDHRGHLPAAQRRRGAALRRHGRGGRQGRRLRHSGPRGRPSASAWRAPTPTWWGCPFTAWWRPSCGPRPSRASRCDRPDGAGRAPRGGAGAHRAGGGGGGARPAVGGAARGDQDVARGGGARRVRPGLRDFGENYAGSWRRRPRPCGTSTGCAGTSSGTCRRNKARGVAAVAYAVQSVDSVRLAEALGRGRRSRGVRWRRGFR